MSRFVEIVMVERPLAVDEAAVMGLSEAAKALGLDQPSSVADLCYRGVLRRVQDMAEPNPRKRGRVLRADVLQELARRQGRPEDRRLKRKRGRPVG